MKGEPRLQRHMDDDDLAHDAFVELKQRGLHAQTSSGCKARIRSLLKWRMIDGARGSIRRSKRQVSDAEGCIANVSVTDPEPQLEIGVIARCKDYLSDEDWQVLHRRIVDEVPIRELLVEFQCSRTTFYERYVRALARLSETANRLGLKQEQ